MKEISKEKIEATIHKMRLRMVLSFFGHSNNLRIDAFLRERPTRPRDMTDEELIVIHQILMAAGNGIIDEMEKRDLVPEEFKQMDAMATQMAEQIAKHEGS